MFNTQFDRQNKVQKFNYYHAKRQKKFKVKRSFSFIRPLLNKIAVSNFLK